MWLDQGDAGWVADVFGLGVGDLWFLKDWEWWDELEILVFCDTCTKSHMVTDNRALGNGEIGRLVHM